MKNVLAEKLYNSIKDVVQTAAEGYLLQREALVLSGTTSSLVVRSPIAGVNVNAEAGDVYVVPVTVSGIDGEYYTYWEFFEIQNTPVAGEIVTLTLTSGDPLPVVPVAGAPVNRVLEGVRTEGGKTVTVTPEVGILQSDESGLAPIDTVLNSIDVAVTLPRTSVVVKSYATAFPMFTESNNSLVLGDFGLGKSLNAGNIPCKKQADFLVMPKAATGGVSLRQFMIYNISLSEGDLSVQYQKDQQLIQEVTFSSTGEPANVTGYPTKKLSNNQCMLLRAGSRVSLHTEPPATAAACSDPCPIIP